MKNARTIKEALKSGEEILIENQIDNAAYDSFALLSDLIKIDKSYYFLHQNELLSDELYDAYIERIQRRAAHIPLQHILGYAHFWRYQFYVNEHVLIPRQDTEILVEEATKRINPDSHVLDMCTGSGCILIALFLETHFAKGIGVDISSEALKIADKNRVALQADQVTFLKSNLFEGLAGKFEHYFDIIVSNPPYIRTKVIKDLDEEVRSHDPMIALDGHEDGLYFYDSITRESVNYIKIDGWLMFEIGFDQAQDVSNIMKRNGFKNIQVVKDLAGLDRVIIGQKL